MIEPQVGQTWSWCDGWISKTRILSKKLYALDKETQNNLYVFSFNDKLELIGKPIKFVSDSKVFLNNLVLDIKDPQIINGHLCTF